MAREKGATAEDREAVQERRREEQVAERQKREQERARRGGLWSRRDFFGRLSWGGFGVVSLFGLLAFVRSAFPRVLFTPPATFKAGLPGDYPVGEVSEKYIKEFRVWIVREPVGFYRDLREMYPFGLHAPLGLIREQIQMSLPRQWLLQNRLQF